MHGRGKENWVNFIKIFDLNLMQLRSEACLHSMKWPSNGHINIISWINATCNYSMNLLHWNDKNWHKMSVAMFSNQQLCSEDFVTSKLRTECCLCNSNSINCKRVRKSETGSKIVDGTGTTWETKWDWQSVFIWKAWNPFQVNQHKFHMFAICKIDKKLRCDYELRADVVYAIVVIYSFENALLSE